MTYELDSSVRIKRTRVRFDRNPFRVIAKFYLHGGESRATNIIKRVLSIPEVQIERILDSTLRDFSERHQRIEVIFLDNFNKVKHLIPTGVKLSKSLELVIGSYFTHEYSIESAALFNPSIVPHPDQSGCNEGEQRFIISLRAVGEGHTSSLVFRQGLLHSNYRIRVDPVSPYVELSRKNVNPTYTRDNFLLKLHELHLEPMITSFIIDALPDIFELGDLQTRIEEVTKQQHDETVISELMEKINWLAESNYEIQFRENSDITERVIFPMSMSDINGIEDARFCKFKDDDGKISYIATYTAYNGRTITPMLLITKDFVKFKMRSFTGSNAVDKNLALFPRKINGMYWMISRVDGENLYIMKSKSLFHWEEAQLLKSPEESWELVQIGNCGSPIETDEGWLVLTHGVGPLRKYCIGAMLLDINEPSKIIAKLPDPIIKPNESERDGYVPNVVYTCGAMIHNEKLIIPYATSDTASGIATISLKKLLNALLKERY
jgi:predicted GH43/DUF377 family glycosyl hydrolase